MPAILRNMYWEYLGPIGEPEGGLIFSIHGATPTARLYLLSGSKTIFFRYGLFRCTGYCSENIQMFFGCQFDLQGSDNEGGINFPDESAGR